MTGRETFKKYARFIHFLTSIFGIFGPRGNLRLLQSASNIHGKLGYLMRYIFLKNAAKRVGQNVLIGRNVTFVHVENLSIGQDVSIHENCHISSLGDITIGSAVSIAHNSTLIASTHTYKDPDIAIKYGPIQPQPIKIEDDVWIGAGVRILGNTHIGSRVIIGANAVVNKNLEKHGIYGGIPTKLIKEIN